MKTVFSELARVNLKSFLNYRNALWVTISTVALNYGLRFFFLQYYFNYTSTLGGWEPNHIYIVVYLSAVVFLTVNCFDSSIYKFFSLAYKGEVEPYLLKPTNKVYYVLFGWMKISNLIAAIFVLAYGIRTFPEIQSHIITLLPLMLVGVISCLSLIGLMSCLTLFIKRQVPSEYIFYELGRLAFIPISAYPKKLGTALLLIIPSLFSVVVPVAVAIRGETQWLTPFMVSSAGLFLLFIFVFKYSLKRFDGMGG